MEQHTLRIEKPWGYEILWAQTNAYLGKILFVRKGERLSYQYHEQKEESIYVADGHIELEYEERGERRLRTLMAGENAHIPPGMRHRITAVEDARIFEVSTPYLEDVIHLQDNYGRA